MRIWRSRSVVDVVAVVVVFVVVVDVVVVFVVVLRGVNVNLA